MAEDIDVKSTARPPVRIASPAGATGIAFAALVPLGLALIVVAIDGIGGLTAETAGTAFIAYAALLLTFFAGARFGHALRAAGVTVAAAATALPVIVALASLYLPDRIAAGILAVAYAGQGAWDVWSADRAQLAAWYGRLRLRTTPIAVLLLIAGVFVLGS